MAENIAGKYFQQYAILMARLNVPLRTPLYVQNFLKTRNEK